MGTKIRVFSLGIDSIHFPEGEVTLQDSPVQIKPHAYNPQGLNACHILDHIQGNIQSKSPSQIKNLQKPYSSQIDKNYSPPFPSGFL
jgi:hypothetical protein